MDQPKKPHPIKTRRFNKYILLHEDYKENKN